MTVNWPEVKQGFNLLRLTAVRVAAIFGFLALYLLFFQGEAVKELARKLNEGQAFSINTYKVDAEEAGYLGEFGKLLSEAATGARRISYAFGNIGTYSRTKEQWKADEEATTIAAERERIVAIWKLQNEQFIKTTPPQAMRQLHHEVLTYFKVLASAPPAEQTNQAALQFFHAAIAFEGSINGRETSHRVDEPSLKLTYKPPLLPAEIDHEGKIEIGRSIKTPLGDIGAKSSAEDGVRRLVVVVEKKFRYFKLDRPFELYIDARPGDYRTVVRREKDPRTLVIEVERIRTN